MRVNAWIVRWLGLSVALLLTAALIAPPASACTGPCSNARVLTSESGHVAVGGTLLIACHDCEGEPAPLAAVDERGRVVAGHAEVVAVAAEPTWLNVATATRYLRWKPVEALAAGSYRLQAVQEGSYCAKQPFAQVWVVPAAAPAQGELSATAELSAANTGLGSRFACQDTCDSAFTYTRRGLVPSIWLTPQLPAADQRFATHIARMVAESPDGDVFASWTELASLRTPAEERDFVDTEMLWFHERRAEYCVALEVFDVVADRRERIGRTCVADTLGELASTAWFSQVGACWLEAPRMEYERAFCADNRAECSGGSEKPACREWRSLCRSVEPSDAGVDSSVTDGADAAVDANTADAAVDASSDESDHHGKPRRDSENGGCACAAVGRTRFEPSAVFSLLMLGLFLARRSRR